MAATKGRKKTAKGKKPYKSKYSDEEKEKFKEEKEKKVSAAKEALVKAISGLDSKKEWIEFLDRVAKRSKFSPSRLSFINQMLVYMQDPEATAVATYQRWRKIKRWPAKGSKGIMIFRPIPINIPIEKASPEDIAGGKIFQDKNGKTVVKTGRIYFSPMYVFDVAVTEGEDLPPDWLAPPTLPDFENKEVFSSSVEKLATLLENKTDGKVKGVKIISKGSKEDIHPKADGWYDRRTKKIVLKRDENRGKMFAVLVHEAGHALLHGDDEDRTIGQKEIEAESTSYIVNKALGLDTGSAAIVYLASWGRGKKEEVIKQIEASAKRIVKAANDILDLLMPIDDDDDESVLGTEEPFVACDSCNKSARKVREPKPRKSISKISPKQLAMGTNHELEHVNLKPGKKPTKKQLTFAEKIALDHLKEDPKYYTHMKQCGLDEPTPSSYKYYLIAEEENTILKGVKSRKEAKDAKIKLPLPWANLAKVVSPVKLNQLGIDPEDKSNWADRAFYNRTRSDLAIKWSEPAPRRDCNTDTNSIRSLKLTARKMGGKISGSNITFDTTAKSKQFESLLKEDEFTYTKNKRGNGNVFTVDCGGASLTMAALGEPTKKRPAKKTNRS